MTGSSERNWAGNLRYAAARLAQPTSPEQVCEIVAAAPRVRALGSRHSFNGIADTTGVLVSLARLPRVIEVDARSRTVTIDGGATYGQVAPEVHAQGWALANLASLPHISVAGAVATGTHGSGDGNGSLATAVAAMELVDADGAPRWLRRGEPDFAGAVVGLGALGIVTRLVLDIEPTFEVATTVFSDVPWDAALANFDDLTAAGYSVSLFTSWEDDVVRQVWVKTRGAAAPGHLFGIAPASSTHHMMSALDPAALTPQLGVPGPWLDRLPHFRMGFTPSNGAEIQSEWLLPRSATLEAIARLRRLGPLVAPLLQTAEIRTVAADALWLSGAYGRDTVGVHFTWLLDVPGVERILPAVDAALLPLGGRPHWGNCSCGGVADLEPLYERFADFRALRQRLDPQRCFGNAYLDRVLGP